LLSNTKLFGRKRSKGSISWSLNPPFVETSFYKQNISVVSSKTRVREGLKKYYFSPLRLMETINWKDNRKEVLSYVLL